jgi:hypothetical protein
VQAYKVLRVLTECTFQNKQPYFSEAAKRLVRERFQIKTEAEVIVKCTKLLIINCGNKQAKITDVLHVPNFDGKVEIPLECMPDFSIKLPKNDLFV